MEPVVRLQARCLQADKSRNRLIHFFLGRDFSSFFWPFERLLRIIPSDISVSDQMPTTTL